LILILPKKLIEICYGEALQKQTSHECICQYLWK